jgi:hypothetical protein
MTTPQTPQRPTRTMQGVYAFPRAEYDKVGGIDLAREAAESRIRRVAREAGHEPEGRVTTTWHDADPEQEGYPDVPDDPDRKWCRARVMVRLHAARVREVGVFCPKCGQSPTVRGDSLVCLTCD